MSSPRSTSPTSAIAPREVRRRRRWRSPLVSWTNTSGASDASSTSRSPRVSATPFQRDVWDALVAIPYGEVRTYGEVARSVNRAGASRAVGNANHVNPYPVVVPCHRVVASTGLGGYGGGAEVKRFLLELEGAAF